MVWVQSRVLGPSQNCSTLKREETKLEAMLSGDQLASLDLFSAN